MSTGEWLTKRKVSRTPRSSAKFAPNKTSKSNTRCCIRTTGVLWCSTMFATSQALGVIPSLSRPRVSNDNAFSESLFGTLKVGPSSLDQPFRSLDVARSWMSTFVRWHNTEHRQGGISLASPNQRHSGKQEDILRRRERTYAVARAKNQERCTRETREWKRHEIVYFNRSKDRNSESIRGIEF